MGHGELEYNPESDMVLNEDSILSEQTQLEKVSKRVSFDLIRSDEDEPMTQAK